MIEISQHNEDYLKRKLDNETEFLALAGATEQERFNNAVSDIKRFEYISHNNVQDNSISVIFLMTYLSLSQAEATATLGVLQVDSSTEIAKACKNRYLHTEKWYLILFSYFEKETCQQITSAISGYVELYTRYGIFGVGYKDTENGLGNFINNTAGVITSLEDYPLIEGTDYNPAKTALTNYFW